MAKFKQQLNPKKKKCNKPFKVWGQNHTALLVFMRCSNCWEINPMSGRRMHLDYHSVTARITPMQSVKALSAADYEQLWNDIDLMQSVALKYWDKLYREQQS